MLTNDATRCKYYKEESENVKGRYECVIPRDILIHNEKNILIPNNKEDCDVSVQGRDGEVKRVRGRRVKCKG